MGNGGAGIFPHGFPGDRGSLHGRYIYFKRSYDLNTPLGIAASQIGAEYDSGNAPFRVIIEKSIVDYYEKNNPVPPTNNSGNTGYIVAQQAGYYGGGFCDIKNCYGITPTGEIITAENSGLVGNDSTPPGKVLILLNIDELLNIKFSTGTSGYYDISNNLDLD